MTDHEALPWMPVSPGFELKLLRGGGDDDTRLSQVRRDLDGAGSASHGGHLVHCR